MPGHDPEVRLERTADELEERLGRLDEHVGEAKAKAADRAGDADTGEGAVGDFEEVHDEGGGDDPSGAGQRKDDDAQE